MKNKESHLNLGGRAPSGGHYGVGEREYTEKGHIRAIKETKTRRELGSKGCHFSAEVCHFFKIKHGKGRIAKQMKKSRQGT